MRDTEQTVMQQPLFIDAATHNPSIGAIASPSSRWYAQQARTCSKSVLLFWSKFVKSALDHVKIES